eukprot:TRINITY_DN564_c0_g1_i3.p1 TRINITY_DN564_c0_g1~~TRINITY_DN564_c0_g1_i3.p1  ORF type:complete len:111 (+),score=52.04 TRINITY_DN564_c0_g1_i3:25-333(+)
MIRRPPRSTLDRSSAASDVYKRQVLMTVTDFEYPGETVSNFVAFRKLKDLSFFFNAVTQLGRNAEMTKVATALDGVHYSVRKGANFTTAFIEALERDPFKGY